LKPLPGSQLPAKPPGTIPANARSLPKRRYDVRGADGRRFLFVVTADEAAHGIASGVYTLAQSRSGAYLKRTADRQIARLNPPKTLSGYAAASRANPAVLYDHNKTVCDAWKLPVKRKG
jgi:hypothetical protein